MILWNFKKGKNTTFGCSEKQPNLIASLSEHYLNALFPKRVGSTSSRSLSCRGLRPPGFASLNLGLLIFDPFGV